jgi:CBS domain-containing protein
MDVADPTVAAVMVTRPKTCDAAATVADVRAVFADDHVHCVLIVEDGVLLAVVERGDVAGVPGAGAAVAAGRLAGRTIGPGAEHEAMRRSMVRARRRRLAVVDADGRLLGLLCLKRTGLGFCSDADTMARAAQRAGVAMCGEVV